MYSEKLSYNNIPLLLVGRLARLVEDTSEEAKELTQRYLRVLIHSWLVASYGYYVHDFSLMEDETYDQIAKTLILFLPAAYRHGLPLRIKEEDLKCGSLFWLSAEEYPPGVRSDFYHIQQKLQES